MGALEDIGEGHALVGLDTPLFVYHLERAEPWLPVTRVLLRQIAQGTYAAVTSVVTITELCTRPLAVGRSDLASAYRAALMQFPNLGVLVIDAATAHQAAALRASYRLRTPDALQIAASLNAGATAFITNDRRLRQVRELEVLIIDDLRDTA